MSSHAVIPLVAAIALLLPLVVLLLRRPRAERGGLFLLYIIPASLWSLTDFALRIGFRADHQSLMVKVTVCLAVWMVVEYHHILRFYGSGQSRRSFLAYLPLVALIGLATSGLTPQSIRITGDATSVSYGAWMVPVAFSVLAFIVRDSYLLVRKWRISVRAEERNQLSYLLLATLIGALLILTAFTPIGTTYATAHIGNMAVALVLVYAMVAHRLVDVGVALRRVLAFSWTTIAVSLLDVLMLWLASVILGFNFTPSLAMVVIGITFCCAAFLHFVNPLSRRAIEGILIGKRYDYRQQLSEFLSNTPAIAEMDKFGNQLLTLLSRSTDSQLAWLLLPDAEDGSFASRCIYTSDGMESVAPLRLAQGNPVLLWLSSERRPLSKSEAQDLAACGDTVGATEGDFPNAHPEIFFPVTNGNQLVAIVALGSKRKGGSHALEEIDLIAALLDGISASIEKEIIRERMQANENDLILLNRLMTVLGSSVDLGEAFTHFSEELQTVSQVDWATIALADGEDLHFIALSSVTQSPWKAGERVPLAGSGTEWVMKERKSLYEPDLLQNRRFSTGEKHVKQGIRSIVYLPLISGGQSIGALTVASCHPQAYDARQVKLLEQMASYVTAPIENSRLYSQARETARVDDLTRLFNRRHFDERLKEETTRRARYGGTFSLLMLDLDSFKAYNDVFGHPAGDELLRQVSTLLKTSIRTSDQAFRYGGDEFAIILPHIDAEAAFPVAERVRQSVARELRASFTGVTASIGLASCPADAGDSSKLIAAADGALYCAKRNGGDCVCLPSDKPLEGAAHLRREGGNIGLTAVCGLMGIMDAQDELTYAHSEAVRGYALCLAEAMELPDEAISTLTAASLLHDLGKIGVPDRMPSTGESVTFKASEEVKDHPKLGAAIVANVPSLASCVPAILYHHEHYDGSGYPTGLRGDDIPLEARILALADFFAHLTSQWPDPMALSWSNAIDELRRRAGTWFDPALVEVFLSAIEPPVCAQHALPSR